LFLESVLDVTVVGEGVQSTSDAVLHLIILAFAGEIDKLLNSALLEHLGVVQLFKSQVGHRRGSALQDQHVRGAQVVQNGVQATQFHNSSAELGVVGDVGQSVQSSSAEFVIV